jgi:hypothetical protein
METVSDKDIEKTKHVLYVLNFFFNCAVFEILLKKIVELGMSQVTIK